MYSVARIAYNLNTNVQKENCNNECINLTGEAAKWGGKSPVCSLKRKRQNGCFGELQVHLR
jgi:hypothetical protein